MKRDRRENPEKNRGRRAQGEEERNRFRSGVVFHGKASSGENPSPRSGGFFFFRKAIFFLLLTTPLLSLSSSPAEAPEPVHRLTVVVSPFREIRGFLILSLFRDPGGWLEEGREFRTKKIKIREKTETVIFRDIPEGSYAVSFYHDENGDGEFNRNPVQIPLEGYGFSGSSEFWFTKPVFEESLFKLNRNIRLSLTPTYDAE